MIRELNIQHSTLNTQHPNKDKEKGWIVRSSRTMTDEGWLGK
ncbi:MAG: hypothetical protein WC975_11385 [Phycisphaerae bacterium]